MNKNIIDIQKARLFLLNIVGDLSVEELNETPSGFNNNIIWNLGHIVYAQQGICYVRSGLPIVIEEKYFREYKSGTKPEHYVDEAEVQKIKDLMVFTSERLASDYEKNIFTTYSKWTTRYGVELGNIDDAITFLLYHEGLHSGVVIALKKLVGKMAPQ
jgi:hypothetical protein